MRGYRCRCRLVRTRSRVPGDHGCAACPFFGVGLERQAGRARRRRGPSAAGDELLEAPRFGFVVAVERGRVDAGRSGLPASRGELADGEGAVAHLGGSFLGDGGEPAVVAQPPDALGGGVGVDAELGGDGLGGVLADQLGGDVGGDRPLVEVGRVDRVSLVGDEQHDVAQRSAQ